MSTIKTRAKNFPKEELTTLVDLVLENKSKLFGSFSSKLTSSDKDAVWEEIARTISGIIKLLGARMICTKDGATCLLNTSQLYVTDY